VLRTLVLFSDLYIFVVVFQSFLLPRAIISGSRVPTETNNLNTNILSKGVLFSTFILFAVVVFLPYLGSVPLLKNNSIVPQYRYSSLSQNSKTIRLLRLLPDEDELKNIECELFEYALPGSNTRNHLYEALSYVWGSEENLQSISVDNQKLKVTQNLHTALLHLRDCNIPRIIWVDAICINQVDEKEKEHQILLLPAIYAKANRVVVWLGEAQSDSDQALEAIRLASAESTQLLNAEPSKQEIGRALQTIHIANEKYNETFSLHNTRKALETSISLVESSLDSSHMHEPFRLSVRRLLQRRWFKRIWVSAHRLSVEVELTKLLYRYCKKWLPRVMF
jgi:hypothetical protein